MASEVDICNRGLVHLGAKLVTSLTENTPNARSCNQIYAGLRDAELRKHPWNFAITRVQLAASSITPVFGRARAFPLPADYLATRPPYPEAHLNSRDWIIEGTEIYTDDGDPLNFRYVRRIEAVERMDPLFQEALGVSIGLALCEQITQSNTKKDFLVKEYKRIMADARKANAFDRIPSESTHDTWETARVSTVPNFPITN